jgi:multidrug resistance efflux pump
MWQKKATAGTTEAQAPPALALRPETEPAEERAFAPFPDNGAKEETAMPDRPRSGRFVWIVGILLLIATVVGAAWALNSGDGNYGNAGQDHPSAPAGIVALGLVDVEPGIAKLYPLQPGRVLFVAPEGLAVKKGDIILSVDKTLATFNLQQAKAALEDARLLLEQAQKKPAKHTIDLAMQKFAIAIAINKTKVAGYELEKKKKLFKEMVISKEDLDIFQEAFDSLQILVKVEEGKLQQLELLDPQVDVKRLQRDVDAKEAQKGKAELALRECDIRAPSDGTVLRVFVQAGEILGPDPKFPAIQFCPNARRIVRAEVLQEWAGHVAKGQKVVIEDDTHPGAQWTGHVKYVSDWITPKRNMILEPFMVNDVRTLECVIDINPGGPPLRIGQRVRVTIEQTNQ